jgi:hypothetical protein
VRTGVFDLLRRGFDNTLANWQLALIRFLEAFVMMILFIVAMVVIAMPILVSIGINAADLDTPEDIESAVSALLQKWVMLVWFLVGISVALLVVMLMHSFIEAGCARVFVDGDRAAGDELSGPRTRFKVFSMQRWVEGGKEGWWTVFWIYNILWGVGLLVILLPLVGLIAAAVIFGSSGGEAGAGIAALIACLGVAITMLFSIAVMIVLAIWTNRAIVDWAVHRTTALAAIGYAGRSIRSDLGRHAGVAVCIFVIAMAASMFFSMFGFFTGLGDSIGDRPELFMLLTAPVRIVTSLLNSAVSALIGSWFVATYASLANHR